MGSSPSKRAEPLEAFTIENDLFKSLQALSKEEPFSKLVEGHQYTLEFLQDLKAVVESTKDIPEIGKWRKEINRLQQKASPQRVVVGVLGSTGAGKSSLINALLDEEDILPTNCMRACTATITEVSYNASNDPNEMYRAEVEFITAGEWAKELDVLLDDIHTGQSIFGPEAFGNESDAGIAYQKVKAVYPALKGDDIKKGRFSVDTLIKEESVDHLLGSVKTVAGTSSDEFVKLLRTFVDSKKKGRGQPREMEAPEFWPLIKVVRLFARSDILRNGLVLVDLPGVQDSNAARSAIASKYIQHCSNIWVVAPINRAVDDLAASKLLSDAFTRQLRFDGAYSAVAVICSKTDDISETELLRELPDDSEARRHHDQLRVMRAKIDECSKKLKPVKTRISQITQEITLCETRIRGLRDALLAADQRHDSMVVLEVPQISRKRPARAAADEARKRVWKQQQDQGSELSDLTNDDEPLFKKGQPTTEEISRDAATQRVQNLEEQVSKLKEEKSSLEGTKTPLEADVDSMNKVSDLLKHQRRGACIQYRNDYAKPEIQKQFAERIRDMEQEDAAYDDEHDPDRTQRDKYRKLAQSLPVFCVSSNAYHKLTGRLQEDESLHGFTKTEETQIPALKEHALSIVAQTEGARYRQLSRDLRRFVIDLHLRIVIGGQPYKLAEDLRMVEEDFLTVAINELQQSFDSIIEEHFNNFEDALYSNIFRKLPSACDIASESAVTTLQRWFSPAREKGFHYGTFRAACVREGVWKNKDGPFDLNNDLSKPFEASLSYGWDRISSTKHFECMADSLSMKTRAFRNSIAQRDVLRMLPVFQSVMRVLEQEEDKIGDVMELDKRFSDGQKVASRTIESTIKEAMLPAYRACREEKGPGCYERMKGLMRTHMEKEADSMFRAAAEKVEETFRTSLDNCKDKISGKCRGVITTLGREFKRVLWEEHRIKVSAASKEAISNLLATGDRRFDEIWHGSPSTPDAEVMERESSVEHNDGFDLAQGDDLTAAPADRDAASSDDYYGAEFRVQDTQDLLVKSEEYEEESDEEYDEE
ncbi:hypothetical protein QBC41DRAFT_264526 [Cercophora samala]|uniref:Nuclear GTPase SLIP-GC n=1 Tax=Cercophora samala TaxID=330535 RepID=A0AA39ZN33_9PEZI|nr:hypothetical protein QBC41DRAFT_264526 [Cercophora samala]